MSDQKAKQEGFLRHCFSKFVAFFRGLLESFIEWMIWDKKPIPHLVRVAATAQTSTPATVAEKVGKQPDLVADETDLTVRSDDGHPRGSSQFTCRPPSSLSGKRVAQRAVKLALDSRLREEAQLREMDMEEERLSRTTRRRRKQRKISPFVDADDY